MKQGKASSWGERAGPARLDFFSGRFNAHVETRFILIPGWNFDVYRLS
jgi:hypothetical protein